MRNWAICGSVLAAACVFAMSPPVALAQVASGARTSGDNSAQRRDTGRRPPVRIDVYRNRVPMVRECAPVFEERWIPQWGGKVLYAGQSCRWVPTR